MGETLLVEANERSGRTAVVADEGHSVWLYLTEPHHMAIAADCWLFNRGLTPSMADLGPRLTEYRAQAVPPPAPAEMVIGEPAPVDWGELSRLRVQWSLDGHAVAAWSEHLLVGFISAGERRGFSRLLAASGPWGAPLDMRLYERLFPADQG